MRGFIRHPSDIPIEIRVQRRPAKERHSLHNVSLGGLSCASDEFLEAGLTVRIRVPFVRPVFETEGRVVWCRRRNGDFDVGIQFINADDAFKVRMVEQVCHIENYKNKVREREGRELNGQEAALEWIGKYAADFPNCGIQDSE